MRYLRTPDTRFENLLGYSFAPNYLEVGDGLRMHYVDEGQRDGPLVLLLHGQPSWSYLYRKMIPVFVAAGFRAIAPDLIGFGKSDKPTEPDAYTYANHINWLHTFIRMLDLQGINMFCQDWGGLLGLRVAVADEGRFDSIIVANTFLPTGDIKPNKSFLAWLEFVRTTTNFDLGRIVNRATVATLDSDVIAAYNAPFPDDSYKAAARTFPFLVPINPDDPETIPNRAAWQKLQQWHKPFLTLFSDSDPIMKGLEKFFQKMVPGAQGQPHEIIKAAGHFLQEDKGKEIAEKVVAFIKMQE